MSANVGSIDRIIRLVAGIVLVALPFLTNMAIFASGTATIISVVVGLILIGTAAMKFCPLYRLFGIQTCRV